MPGRQFTTMVEEDLDLGSGTATNKTVKLPTAHSITALYIRERATHASAITITQDEIEWSVNGAPLAVGLTGDQIGKLSKVILGRDADDTGAGGAEHIIERWIPLGNFVGDANLGLPAPLFENVQLRVKSSLSATPTAHELTVAVVELPDADPAQMTMRKWSQVDSWAPSASEQHDTELNLGNVTPAVYLDYNDVDNIDGENIILGANNLSTRFYQATIDTILAQNRAQYPYHDDTIPTTFAVLDLAAAGTAGLVASKDGGVRDLKLRTKADSSGTSGTVYAIQEELIPVRG